MKDPLDISIGNYRSNSSNRTDNAFLEYIRNWFGRGDNWDETRLEMLSLLATLRGNNILYNCLSLD